MTEQERIFEQVYRAYGPALYRFCLLQMKNPADAEDILQEVFYKRLYRSPSFASPDHERRWLFRVALNQCRDAWKHASRSELPLEVASDTVTPEELERKLTLLNDALEKTMRTEDVSCIREVLHRVVPTFHEPEEVNAAQGEEVKAPVPAVS